MRASADLGLDSLAAELSPPGCRSGWAGRCRSPCCGSTPTSPSSPRTWAARASRHPLARGASGRGAGAHRHCRHGLPLPRRRGHAPRPSGSLLRAGTDAVTDMPRERFDVDALYRPDPATSGHHPHAAGRLPARGRHRASIRAFFGISPREASHMDPQQRVALELAWEALEDAGIPPHSLAGSATGVFMGAIWSDFALLMGRLGLEAIAPHTVTGHAPQHHRQPRLLYAGARGAEHGHRHGLLGLAGRRAPGVREPAQRRVHAGASPAACNLILAPDSMVQMARFGATSLSGRCRSFDADGRRLRAGPRAPASSCSSACRAPSRTATPSSA